MQEVLKERVEKGIKDEQGVEPTALNSPDYYQLGNETLAALGSQQAGRTEPLFGFEGIDYTLKSHLFGYLFSRDNLSAVNREIVTVSTLASLETVQNQLRSHLGILKNLGFNETELKRIIAELHKINPAAVDKAEGVLSQLQK